MLLFRCKSKANAGKVRQDTADTVISSLKMLSHGAALLHNARRDQFKQFLDPGVLRRMQQPQAKPLKNTNTSHQLFGGELQKQAKEGLH